MNSAFRPLIFVLVVFGGMTAISAYRKATEPAERVAWRPTLSAAKAESAIGKKPVIAYFTASWCPPCQQMKRETWSDARVGEALAAGFVPVKVDVSQLPDVAREFGVETIPRIQVIYPDGRLGPSHVGIFLPNELLEWLRGL